MSYNPKKQFEKDSLILKSKSFALLIIRFVVSFFRTYLKLRIWVPIIVLLIMMLMGDLLTKGGLLVTLFILGYILLGYLDKWLEKHENN